MKLFKSEKAHFYEKIYSNIEKKSIDFRGLCGYLAAKTTDFSTETSK